MKDVPYIVYEGELARLERIIRKLFVLLFVCIALLVATNGYWIWNESQYEDVVTVTQDNTDGYNNYVGDDGDIINGETDN